MKFDLIKKFTCIGSVDIGVVVDIGFVVDMLVLALYNTVAADFDRPPGSCRIAVQARSQSRQ